MLKCKKCKLNKYRLKCLECEQKAEDGHRILKPEIITPLKNLSLKDLTDKEKAVLLLKIVGELSLRRITTLLSMDNRTVTSYLKSAYKKIKSLKVF